jgi:hypothetical protein
MQFWDPTVNGTGVALALTIVGIESNIHRNTIYGWLQAMLMKVQLNLKIRRADCKNC